MNGDEFRCDRHDLSATIDYDSYGVAEPPIQFSSSQANEGGRGMPQIYRDNHATLSTLLHEAVGRSGRWFGFMRLGR